MAYSHRIPIPTLDIHAINRLFWLTPILGLDDGPADSRIYLSAETEMDAERLLEQHSSQQFGALVPGTMWETKHWDPARFAEVGLWLKQRGFGVVLLGTLRDQTRCHTIAKICPGAIDFSGQTNPAQLASLLK